MQDPSRLARRTSATDSLAGLRAEHAVTEPGSLHFTFRSSDPPICLCEFRLCGVLDSLFPPMTLSRPFSSFLVLSRPFSPLHRPLLSRPSVLPAAQEIPGAAPQNPRCDFCSDRFF